MASRSRFPRLRERSVRNGNRATRQEANEAPIVDFYGSCSSRTQSNRRRTPSDPRTNAGSRIRELQDVRRNGGMLARNLSRCSPMIILIIIIITSRQRVRLLARSSSIALKAPSKSCWINFRNSAPSAGNSKRKRKRLPRGRQEGGPPEEGN